MIRYRDGGGFAARDDPDRTYHQPVPAGTLPRDWFTADYARKSERTGYPTQKPEALLARLIAASSEPGDLVADLFAGSGHDRGRGGTPGPSLARRGRQPVRDRHDTAAPPRAARVGRRFRPRRARGRPPGTRDARLRRSLGAGFGSLAPGLACLGGSARDLRAVVAWAIGTRDGPPADPSVWPADGRPDPPPRAPFVAVRAAASDPWTGELATELTASGTGAPAPGTSGAAGVLLARAWTVDGGVINLPITA